LAVLAWHRPTSPVPGIKSVPKKVGAKIVKHIQSYTNKVKRKRGVGKIKHTAKAKGNHQQEFLEMLLERCLLASAPVKYMQTISSESLGLKICLCFLMTKFKLRRRNSKSKKNVHFGISKELGG